MIPPCALCVHFSAHQRPVHFVQFQKLLKRSPRIVLPMLCTINSESLCKFQARIVEVSLRDSNFF